MTDSTAGFRFWGIEYDDKGGPVGAGGRQLEAELASSGVTDLFIISHGWNNNAAMARLLYDRFFEQVAEVLGGPRDTIGVAGITWPSMQWPDEELPGARFGGAAGFDDSPLAPAADDAAIVAALRDVYPDPGAQAALDEIQELLERQPSEEAELERFQDLLGVLAAGADVPDAENDGGEAIMLEAPATVVFDEAADLDPEDFQGGAEAAGDSGFSRLWSGARQALRQTTYWNMKKRAGIVGSTGVTSLIERLAKASPSLRIHLIGHSFGARLVSYAVGGLSDEALADGSPVKSVTLLQGAFSHFAFAASLPHDQGRSGGLAGAAKRIDGPLLVTFTQHDRAVGYLYPRASILGRDDAAATEDPMYRWGALGHDGAQNSDATTMTVKPAKESYGFGAGQIHNLDANDVIVAGEGASGAHSDLFHPELAWAVLDAAKISA